VGGSGGHGGAGARTARPASGLRRAMVTAAAVACLVGAVAAALLPGPSGSMPVTVGRVVAPRALRATRPEGPGALLEPVGIAVDSGRLYVADARRGDIVVLSTTGEYRSSIGVGRLEVPLYVAVNPRDRRLYVTDRTLRAVLSFRQDGSFAGTFTPEPSDARGIAVTAAWRPLGLAFGDDGTMYVSDAEGALLAFGSDGRLAAESGDDIPTGPAGRLSFANGIAVLDDAVVVADANNSRILVLGRDLSFRAVAGFPGLPRGVAAPYGPGAVVVADTTGSALRVLDMSGAVLASAGARGSAQASLSRPTGLAADGAGNLYVVDAGNARVSVWDVGSVGRADILLELMTDPRTWTIVSLLGIGGGLAIWSIRTGRNSRTGV
jgi:DNA-binding beta-propeller fold protein YncE